MTTLSRTVVDLTRALTFSGGVVLGDAALAAGLGSAELERSLLRARGINGVGRARRVAAFVDGLSESPGESLSRVVFAQAGLQAPTVQRSVFGPDGDLVGRADFCWEEQQTLGEFDGKIKYGRLLAPGQTPGDVVWAEKLREDAMRGLGWQIVRWTWDDLRHPTSLRERVRRAFARAHR